MNIWCERQASGTRVVAEATQTNMNLEKAISMLKDKIVMELTGIFQ